MIRYIFILSIALLSLNNLQAQLGVTTSKPSFITLDASVGSAFFLTYLGAATEIGNHTIGPKLRSRSRVSLGYLTQTFSNTGSSLDYGWNIYAGHTFLFGQKNKFLEVGIGLNMLIWRESLGTFRESELKPLPGLNIGYRSRGKKSKFRAGIGFPELLYIGFGG